MQYVLMNYSDLTAILYILRVYNQALKLHEN